MKSRSAAPRGFTAANRAIARVRRFTRQRTFLILATLGLTLVLDMSVALQLRLSTYAANGGGSHGTIAPPALVLLSLVLPLVVALALLWSLGNKRGWPLSRDMDPLYKPIWSGADDTTIAAPAPRLTLRFWRWHWRWIPRTRRAWACVVCLTLALLASAVADVLAAVPTARPVAQWWWAASVLLVAATAATTGGRTRLRAWMAPARLRAASGDAALLLILVVGSLALRLPNLTTLPYPIHGDEAACGIEAVRWLSGGVSSAIATSWYGLPELGFALPAVVMRFVGADLWGLRFASVLAGTGTVVLLYILAREFAGRRLAFIAAALLAVAHIDIQFSRQGIHYIYAPLVVELTLWLLVRALRRERVLAAALAGIGMSLALQIYFSARILYVIVPLFLLGLWLADHRRMGRRAHLLGWLALSFVVAVGPLGVFFAQNPDPLLGHSVGVLILNLTPDIRGHLISQYGTASLATIIPRQIATVPLLLGTMTDQSLQYGAHYPLFDPLVAATIVVGFWYAVLRLRHPLCLLLVCWVMLTLVLGVVLTLDTPWWPRVFVMVPALCLLAALAVEAILRWLEGVALVVVRTLSRPDEVSMRRLALPVTLLAVGLIVYSGAVSAHHYFVDYPATINPDANLTANTDIGRYLASVPSNTRIVLFSGGDVVWSYSTLQFLAPQAQGQQATGAEELLAVLSHPGNEPTLVIVTQSAMRAFDVMRTMSGVLPPGSYTARANLWGRVTFATYAIAAAAPTALVTARVPEIRHLR